MNAVPLASRATVSLLGRDLARARRYPASTLRTLLFPLFFVVVVSGTFGAAADLVGFPARSLLDWVLPTGMVAAATSAATIPVFAMARDRESGFFDRLLLGTTRPIEILLGPLLAGLTRAVIPFVIVLSLGLLAGVDVPGGVSAVGIAFVAAEASAFCAAAWGLGVALRRGSVRRTIQPVQLVNFLVLYMSTAQMPLAYLTGWLRWVAGINPMTHVLALGRQGFIGPVTWNESWPGLLVLVAGGALLLAFAVRSLTAITRS